MARKASKSSKRSYTKLSKALSRRPNASSNQTGKTADPSVRSLKTMGSLAFLFGIMIALLTGVLMPGAPNVVVTALLLVLGTIAGFLNVTKRETVSFLLATVSLVLVSEFAIENLKHAIIIGKYFESMFVYLLTFVIPATIIVALKQVYQLEED